MICSNPVDNTFPEKHAWNSRITRINQQHRPQNAIIQLIQPVGETERNVWPGVRGWVQAGDVWGLGHSSQPPWLESGWLWPSTNTPWKISCVGFRLHANRSDTAALRRLSKLQFMNQSCEFAVKCVEKQWDSHLSSWKESLSPPADVGWFYSSMWPVQGLGCVCDGHNIGGFRLVTLFCVSWWHSSAHRQV